MTCLKLVHSVPFSMVQRHTRAEKKSNLEQRLLYVATQLEQSEKVCNEKTNRIDELESSVKELRAEVESLEESRSDLEAQVSDLNDGRIAALTQAKECAEHMRKVLGLEHAYETMERFELRRAFEDFVDAIEAES